jgi:hypothetical protein
MATKKNSASPVVARVRGWLRLLELERSFFIFSVIYFPVTWLFLYQEGLVERTILAVYTIVLAVIGLLMLIKFAFFLAEQADNHTGNYGTLLIRYLANMFFPLVMFKAFAYVIFQLLPAEHEGLVCHFIWLYKALYLRIFDFQHAISLVILGSAALVWVFVLWSVSKRSN